MTENATLRLISTLVGQPRPLGLSHGQPVSSSIDRQPTDQANLYLTHLGLANDRCSDSRPDDNGEPMHGSLAQAVYAYPLESYPLWDAELGLGVRGLRHFGENLQIEGATENTARVGDLWHIGEIILQITKPRQPCATLGRYYPGLRIQDRMYKNGLCGWYLRVIQPGNMPTSGLIRVEPGDGPTIAEAFAAKIRQVT